MGRYCRICGKERPNERFGGKGRRKIICSKCRRLPRKKQDRILATDELYGFLHQSNISAKNIRRLKELAKLDDDIEFNEFRELVLEVAIAHPRKRKRWPHLKREHSDLYARVLDSGHFFFVREWLENELERSLSDFDLDCSPIQGEPSLIGVWLENPEF